MAKPGSDKFGRFQKRQAPEAEQAPESELGEDLELGQERDFGREQQSPDRVARMQSQLGNQAVLEVVTEEGLGEEVESAVQDEAKSSAISAPQTGLPAVHDAAGDLDWNLLWGDDDDDDDDVLLPPPRARPRPRRRSHPGGGGEDRDAEDRRDVAYAREAPASPDVLIDGLWRWIVDPEAASDPAPEPEGLLALDRSHPLARCRTAGTFLAQTASSPLARALAGLAGPLPGGPGLAAQIARAAAQVSAAVAVEAGPPGDHESVAGVMAGVARAVAVALEDDARARVEGMVPWVAKQQRLAAHLLFDACSEDDVPDTPGALTRPRPDLVEAAVRANANPWPIQDPPSYPQDEAPDVSLDPELALLDMILRQATSGGSSMLVEPAALKGVQQGAWNLLEAAGGAQRELAAAGLAAWRIAGEGSRRRLRALLSAADEGLRGLAKTTYFAGRRLGELEGASLAEARPALAELDTELADCTQRLRRLRDSAFSAIARIAAGGAVEALSARGRAVLSDRTAVRSVAARTARADEVAMIDAAGALRNGGLPLAMLRACAAGGGVAGAAMSLLLSGGLLSTGEAAEAEAVAEGAAALALGWEDWPLFTSASLDHAAALGMLRGGVAERGAIEVALLAAEAGGDAGVLFQARLMELDRLD